MNKMIILTRTEYLDGFRLAGVDVIGVDDVETVERLILSWLKKKEKVLLAINDDLFSQLAPNFIKQIYASDEMLLVTIPDKPVSEGEKARNKQIYDMIRHATGVQIHFKGEVNGA